ncbi:phosphoribosylanthranilate isomerase [Methylotetracoccus oryzae]|uniref:phosphoribosylanthranilate isomerase n=1 Tax=Methylotetracoccus oryzae TaxID=1919059 RepID=UPI00111BC7E8|nr:phosphoribosylanthranilate isomerase [Methylotetracoccus oryzae]
MTAYPWQRTRVKICGLTQPGDAEQAVALGADAIGLVFYPPSPRAVDIDRAQAVLAAVGPFVTVVGLFVNATGHEVDGVLSKVRIDLLQFHGDESPEYCASFRKPYVRALQMAPDIDLAAEFARFPDALALLLDAYHGDIRGGTGQAFDWQRAVAPPGRQLILAGGLNPDNVGQALEVARPYAVDVSSGVESAKGIKDAARIARFLTEVYDFDQRQRSR